MTGRVVRVLLVAASMLVAAGCQSTADRAREAAASAAADVAPTTVEIEQAPAIESSVEALVQGADGNVVVVVRFTSAEQGRAFVWAPIDVRLLGRDGAVLAQSNVAGADPSLIHVPSIAPGASGWYVNDQLYPPDPSLVDHAEVTLGGEPVTLVAPLENLTVTGATLAADGDFGPSFRATIRNDTTVRQEQVVVQGIVRERGAVVAAGTAFVAGLAPGQSAEVEGFINGAAAGGELEVFAPASNAPGVPGAPAVPAT